MGQNPIPEESNLGGQFSELTEDVIYEIGKRLINYADYVRLRSTCKSFHNMLPKIPRHQQLSQVPWLMIPTETHCNFFNLSENKMYRLTSDIPNESGKLLRGSSYGWVLVVDGNPDLYLINPFTKAKIQLPPLYTFPYVVEFRPNMVDEEYLIYRKSKFQTRSIDYFRRVCIKKAVLSTNPTSTSSSADDYMIAAIHGEFSELAFYRRGDKKWTLAHEKKRDHYHDVISHEGKFYILSGDGGIWVCDIDSIPEIILLVPPPPMVLSDHFCLVRTTSGGFMTVKKVKEWEAISNPREFFVYKTICFRIFKVDGSKWTEVDSIGDDAFFLGKNTSFSLSSKDLPAGCKGNCIYFTDDYSEGHIEGLIGGYDMGVYNLEDRTIEPFKGYACDDSLLVWPPPIWVIPNPGP